jgi:hypothetical protein
MRNLPKLNFLVFGPGIVAQNYKSHRLAVKQMIIKNKEQNADFPEEVDETLRKFRNRSRPSFEKEILANPATRELVMIRGYDYIILPLINLGAISEFSLFSADPVIASKIRLFIPKKHAKSKGFVNTGPVKAFKDAYDQVKIFKDAKELLKKVGETVDSLIVMRLYQSRHANPY